MACVSEGEVPASANRYQLTGSEDDAGITARLAKKLVAWTSPAAGKLEVIRPGTFTYQYIRSTGLRSPVLIKGDRFNESPQLGLMWPDVHNISVDVLSDYIGGDRKVDTWDVMKQRPGPAWTLSQWCTYWHARLDAATRQARPATAHGAPGMLINEDDDEEGEVVDSGVVIVLQSAQGAPHSRYNPAPACVGISPEQAQRLLDGECLPLHGSQLCQHIHPPPAIVQVDLVHQVERELEVMCRELSDKRAAAAPAPAAAAAKSDVLRASAAAADTSRRVDSSKKKTELGQEERFTSLSINPPDTLHLQMTPQDCYSDFRMAPGGAATWLYVLKGVKVIVLIPPTVHNRRLFLTWATATRANQPKENVLVESFLADYAESAVRVQLKASQAVVIPAGWFYASAAITDTLAVGCFFWHPYCLADTARVQQMELQLKLKPQRFSLPARNLLWYAGVAYCYKMRKELGLPDLMLQQPQEHNAKRSVSEASLNQQQRASPYLRALPGPAAAGGGEQQQQQRRRLVRNAGGSATPSNTPPLLGTPGQQQLLENVSGLESPMGHRNKRGRQSDVMEQLYLGDAAVPVAAAAGICDEARQQQQPKRIRLSNGKPTTPLLAGVAAPGAVGVTGSAVSTPRSSNRALLQHPTAAAAAPSSSNQSGRFLRLQNGGGVLPGVQHHQPLHTPRGRGRYAVIDDDDDGECHTSPVRKPEPEPLDEAAAADGYVNWGARQQELQQQQQQQGGYVAAPETARPITALKIRVPGRTQPLYSPVVQPLKGDLDSIPPIEQQQPAAVTPTAAAARKAAEKAGNLLLPPAPAGAPAAAAGIATPGRKKLTLKGQATPTAAAAAAAGSNVVWPGSSPAPAAAVVQPQQQPVRRKSSPDQESSAGSHAVSVAGTHTSEGQQQQGIAGSAADTVHQQQHPRVVLEPASEDGDDDEQQLGHGQQLQHVAGKGEQPMQSQLLRPGAAATAAAATQQRRVSDSGAPRPVTTPAVTAAGTPAAAATAVKAPMKLKFKLASPSPRLAFLQAPQTGAEVPPTLLLDAPATALQQQQHQQCDSNPGLQASAATIPQVDGAGASGPVHGEVLNMAHPMDMDAVVLQGQLAMQQLLQRQEQQQQPQQQGPQQQLTLWPRWQQLQGQIQPVHQQIGLGKAAVKTPIAAAAYVIPQIDGAVDDGRPVVLAPTLVLQPAAAAITAATSQPLAAAVHSEQLPGHVGPSGAASAGVSAAATGFSLPLDTQTQHQLKLPMQGQGHSVVKPRAAQQQELQPVTAVAPVHPTQPGIVLPRNPVLQPQVHKLRQAAAAKASSPDANSPRDKVPSPRLASQLLVQQQQHRHLGVAAPGSPTVQGPLVVGSVAAAGQPSDPQLADLKDLCNAPSFTHWTHQTSGQGAGDAATKTAATAAGNTGDFNRAGSSGLLVLPGAVPAGAAAAAAAQAPAAVARRSSVGVMGETMAAAFPRLSPPSFTAAMDGANGLSLTQHPGAAAPQQQQQQQGVMGPPPPTRLSGWEVLGLPMVIELLHEQVMDKLCEAPKLDPDLVLQQLQETMMEARRREKQQLISRAAAGGAAAEQHAAGPASKQQYQQQQQQQVAAVGEAEMQQLQVERGPLVVCPLSQQEMPLGFWEHCRLGQQLLRANGALPGLGGDLGGQHDTTTEVVGDHNPHEGSAGAGSWDNRSVGSIGGSKGVGGAGGAAAAAAAAGDVGRSGRPGAVLVGRHQQVKRPETLGLQQAKNLKKKQLLKGIGIKR